MPSNNSSGTVKITLVSNVGSGRVGPLEVESSRPIGDILNDILGISSEGVSLRVNGQQASPSQTLSQGDSLTVTPQKVSGA